MDSNDKAYGILSYIGFLCLIPIIAGKTEFSRFHANQGLVLFLTEIAINVVFNILGVIPFIGWIFTAIAGLCDLACFVFAILGIVNAAQGEMKELPVIGTIKIIK